MDRPLEWGKKIIAAVSPRNRTDNSPRAEPVQSPSAEQTSSSHKEPSPRTPEDCTILATLAVEIDQLYRTSKEIIKQERVEKAYIKALACFVKTYTYEESNKNIDLQLKKLQALYLQLESEKRQQNPSYVMSGQTLELMDKVHDLLKRYVTKEGPHE